MESKRRYTKDQLRTVWHFIRNGKTLEDLRVSMQITEQEVNDVYYQAYKLFGLDNPGNMPKPVKGSLVIKKPKVKKHPKGEPVIVNDDPTLLTRYLERPKDEYTNKGYLSLLKQYAE